MWYVLDAHVRLAVVAIENLAVQVRGVQVLVRPRDSTRLAPPRVRAEEIVDHTLGKEDRQAVAMVGSLLEGLGERVRVRYLQLLARGLDPGLDLPFGQ